MRPAREPGARTWRPGPARASPAAPTPSPPIQTGSPSPASDGGQVGGRDRAAGRAPRPGRRRPGAVGGREQLAAAGVEHRHDQRALRARPRATPRASASSDEAPVTGTRRACPSPSAVARPMRRPVKPPGPDAHDDVVDVVHASAPTEASSPWTASSTRGRRRARGRASSSATGSSSRTSARLGLAVEVSSAKVGKLAAQVGTEVRVPGVQQYQPPIAAPVAQFHLEPGGRQGLEDGVGPLHEGHRVGAHGVAQQLGLLVVGAARAGRRRRGPPRPRRPGSAGRP